MPKCDICGTALAPGEMHTLPGSEIARATANGYLPSKLPLEELFLATGATRESVWTMTVQRNADNPWGVCAGCLSQVNRYRGTGASSTSIGTSASPRRSIETPRADMNSRADAEEVYSFSEPDLPVADPDRNGQGRFPSEDADIPVADKDAPAAGADDHGIPLAERDAPVAEIEHEDVPLAAKEEALTSEDIEAWNANLAGLRAEIRESVDQAQAKAGRGDWDGAIIILEELLDREGGEELTQPEAQGVLLPLAICTEKLAGELLEAITRPFAAEFDELFALCASCRKNEREDVIARWMLRHDVEGMRSRFAKKAGSTKLVQQVYSLLAEAEILDVERKRIARRSAAQRRADRVGTVLQWNKGSPTHSRCSKCWRRIEKGNQLLATCPHCGATKLAEFFGGFAAAAVLLLAALVCSVCLVSSISYRLLVFAVAAVPGALVLIWVISAGIRGLTVTEKPRRQSLEPEEEARPRKKAKPSPADSTASGQAKRTGKTSEAGPDGTPQAPPRAAGSKAGVSHEVVFFLFHKRKFSPCPNGPVAQFMKLTKQRSLAGAEIRFGDTEQTLDDKANLFCIRVRTPPGPTRSYLMKKLKAFALPGVRVVTDPEAPDVRGDYPVFGRVGPNGEFATEFEPFYRKYASETGWDQA